MGSSYIHSSDLSLNRYGFVTFENVDDASKLLKEEVCMNDVSDLCKVHFNPLPI